MSVFKDFPGLENLEKIQGFQGPARVLITACRHEARNAAVLQHT